MKKKQQILVIHGGDSFADEKAYLESLRTKDWNLERLRLKDDWKQRLPDNLGKNFDIFYPKFPAHNARYNEWKIIFEGALHKLDDGVWLIGHSLGGTFLGKYLSEENPPIEIDRVFMVAATYSASDYENSDPDLVDFYYPADVSVIKDKAKEVHLYHSPGDPVVPYADFVQWQNKLHGDNVHFHKLPEGYLHVNGPEFPEILEDLK